MINTVKNTAIFNRSYNARGLVGHRFNSRSVVQQSNGHLWAGIVNSLSGNELNLLKSEDGGFSWRKVWVGSARSPHTRNTNVNATSVAVQVLENMNRVFFWHIGGLDSSTGLTLRIFTLDGEEVDWEQPLAYNDLGDTGGVARFPYNENVLGILAVINGQLTLRRYSPANPHPPLGVTGGGSYLRMFDAQMRSSGVVDIAIMNSSNQLRYVTWNPATGSFDSSNLITNTNNNVANVTLVRDGQGRMLVAWSEDTSSQSIVRYAVSSNGETWSVQTVTKSGHYVDPARNEANSRVTALAGINGFIISYTGRLGGVPRTFVRTVAPNGQMGQEREIGKVSHPGEPITGLQFFEPPHPSKLSLDAPEMARVAFQVGEASSTTGEDSTPVRFAQELLLESAFAEAPTLVDHDEPEENETLVKVSVMPGPSSNVDYYTQGMTGRITQRHLAAFKRIGTNVKIRRYDPLVASEMNDRSAYGAAEEKTERVIVTPMSYQNPFAATQDDFTSFIERDARKVHLPPNLHIAREFVLNKGNFLKRTVWTYYFDGNEYEISQVVPNFVRGQLTHYTANSYVVGPSNDPFSRKTLPSET